MQQHIWKGSSTSQMHSTDSFIQVYGSNLLKVGRCVQESVNKKLCK